MFLFRSDGEFGGEMFLLAENMLIQIPGGLFSFSKAINLRLSEHRLHGFPMCDVETEMLQNNRPFSAFCTINTIPCKNGTFRQ